jgi:hypothetical protein
MKRQITFSRLVVTLGVALLGTSPAWAQSQTEAQAEVGSAPAATSATTAARHCIVELSPVADGEKGSAMGKVSCHTSFAAAMAAATDNTVALAADATPESMKEADVAAAATRIIGIDYDRSYYGGASFTWYARNIYGCYGGRSYTANMPGYFNNRLSSTRGFSGCNRNTSYDGYYQSGDWVRCFPNCYYVGGFMDNRASSKRWSW